MQVWQHLGKAAPDSYEEGEIGELQLVRLTEGMPEPHPGLRSYPFLGQVCFKSLPVSCGPSFSMNLIATMSQWLDSSAIIIEGSLASLGSKTHMTHIHLKRKAE